MSLNLRNVKKPAFLGQLGYVVLAAFSTVLAFPDLCWVPLIFLCPFALFQIEKRCRSRRSTLGYGFLVSVLMTFGSGYWIAYALHHFGELPWGIAGGLFLLFAGFEVLNIPLFLFLVFVTKQKIHFASLRRPLRELWYTIGFPSLFIGLEWAVPKVFPWYLGHCFARFPYFIQISEITGSLFLSFAIVSLAGAVTIYAHEHPKRPHFIAALIPAFFWVVIIGFGAYRMMPSPLPSESPWPIALIQGNVDPAGPIQSRFLAKDLSPKMWKTIAAYSQLTLLALSQSPRPELIIWPEAVFPAAPDDPSIPISREFRDKVIEWNVPLLVGAYGNDPQDSRIIYNSAYLLEPLPDHTVKIQKYHKNKSLPFGEYIPGGKWFPQIYQQFSELVPFKAGEKPQAFTLKGQNLGVSICYEAVFPSYFRELAQNPIRAAVNLTNDYWFGPTNEPLFHARLTVFRAVENRIPLIRAANSGLSYFVDDRGRMSEVSPLFQAGVIPGKIYLSAMTPSTIYAKCGDWFVGLSLFLFGGLFLVSRNRRMTY